MTSGRGAVARDVATLAGVAPQDRVVDLGCGPGAAVREASRRGAAATGVDPDPTMLRLARLISRVRRTRRVTWQRGSADRVWLPDGAATIVWALSSAHHWPDRAAGLTEARRLLAPGGQVLIVERLTLLGSHGHAAHGLTCDQAHDVASDLQAAGLADTAIVVHQMGRKRMVVITGRRPELSSPG
jgi:SAM-dependent methyltransferase